MFAEKKRIVYTEFDKCYIGDISSYAKNNNDFR